MTQQSVDPFLLQAWLAARSIARGLPAPVPDRGGLRVETGSDLEITRWVFARAEPGLRELAASITAPAYLLKLCGEADELRSLVTPAWEVHPLGYFMQADARPPAPALAKGYRLEISRNGAVIEARIGTARGEPAARGCAAETAQAFVYDRIVTEAAHRRKGLGRAIMAALGAARAKPVPELLVATADGRALYATLGWKVLSPFATAAIPARPG